jgi:peptidyl-prolyl cis-trans isomerase B (cyclophilin B)
MRLGALRVAAALALATLLSGARAADGDVLFEAVLDQRSVRVGEDASLLVTITNRSSGTIRAPALRLAKDSVSVRVAWPGGGATLTRLYGSFLENDKGALEFKPTPTQTRLLSPGETISARHLVPALLGGEMTLTAVLADGAPTKLEAKPQTLEVEGRQRIAAQVETSRGSFRVDLDASAAYGAVANFWSLAKEHAFDNLPFHRVVAAALVQTGDPRGDGTGDRGWFVPGEAAVTSANRGDVGFARGAHADSAGSQWFVVTDAKGALAGGYVRLGTIGEGLEIADALAANESDPRTQKPKTPDRVVTVKTTLK